METFVMTIDKWKYNYRLVKRQFWTVLAVIVLGVVVLFAKCETSVQEENSGVEYVLDEAIREYESNGGHKIYPYGRACLLKKAMERNIKTKEQMRGLLDENKSWIEK